MKQSRVLAVLTVAVMAICSTATANATSAQRNGTFYLNMARGCYSETGTDRDVAADNPNYKTQYRSSCKRPHHYQVFFVTQVRGYSSTRNLTQSKAKEICVAAYERYLGYSIYDGDADSPSVQWFFPDDGAEARRFPGRLICAFIKTDSMMKTIFSWTGEY